jgi:hypothetical protein
MSHVAARLSRLFAEFAQQTRVQHVVIDAKNGMGATPNGADIDYFGVQVRMKPLVFLDLADKLRGGAQRIAAIANKIEEGAPIAPPFLTIMVPSNWRDADFSGVLPKIVGHDGRHRMRAVAQVFGPEPIPVNLFLKSPDRQWRGSNITPDVLDHLRKGMIEQDGSRVVQDAF